MLAASYKADLAPEAIVAAFGSGLATKVEVATAVPLAPSVRRLVEEHALDPAAIAASGKGGRLNKGDVLAHLAQPAAEPAFVAAPPSTPASASASVLPDSDGAGERIVPMSRIRLRIAERLVQAQQTAAILTTFNEVDMSRVMDTRARYKDGFEKKHGVKLGFMSFFTRACVLAMQDVPAINAEIRGSDIVFHDFVHLGIAASTGNRECSAGAS